MSSDTKIQIWKQFTTRRRPSRRLIRCVIRYKDTNLKAIHNMMMITCLLWLAVSSDTKIQIWKQFTTLETQHRPHGRLCHPIQRYKFESNSQHTHGLLAAHGSCVIRYKDTNLKAIHNHNSCFKFIRWAVSSDTKIQIWKQFTTGFQGLLSERQLCHPIQRYKFESNSQHDVEMITPINRCVIRYKDTNLKAIHNA